MPANPKRSANPDRSASPNRSANDDGSASKSRLLQDVFGSELAVRFGLFMGQHLPRRVWSALARLFANAVTRYKPDSYWTVHANLRHVVGPQVDEVVLHEIVRQVFCHAGQTYYDFYRAIGRTPEEWVRAVRMPGSYLDLIQAEVARGQGVLVLGLHISNFDLAMLALGSCGFPIQALSLADPRAGFRVQNQLRAKSGIEITPISPESLRLAVRRLRSGWVVFTGGDRPVPDDQELTEFFGRPARLPLGSARLALMTGATVLVASCHYAPGTGYAIDFSGPVEMVHTGDRQRDIRTNARRMAAVLEEHVRAYPEQWLMFHRLWPEG